MTSSRSTSHCDQCDDKVPDDNFNVYCPSTSDTETLLVKTWVENKDSLHSPHRIVVDYKSIKRELQRRPIYECRCDERLKTESEGSTRLAYTGFRGGLEHLKIETRLIDEKFTSVG